jgi:hypothetical protein
MPGCPAHGAIVQAISTVDITTAEIAGNLRGFTKAAVSDGSLFPIQTPAAYAGKMVVLSVSRHN